MINLINLRFSEYFSQLLFLLRWNQIPSMSLPRLSATSILDDNNNMWVFGGTYDLQTGSTLT